MWSRSYLEATVGSDSPDGTSDTLLPRTRESGQGVSATVIIGGGQGGVQAATSLRHEGYAGSITVVAEERGVPYQRPPLSKEFMKPGHEGKAIALRDPQFYADQDITVVDGVRAESIDRGHRTVLLDDGTGLAYDHLVLATGARNRRLDCAGAGLPGIYGLRGVEDAQALQEELRTARNIVVVGAGFIGLEFATAALEFGGSVTVLEFAPRPMGRALTPVMSEWFAAELRAMGVDLHLNEGIQAFTAGPDGRVASAVSTTGNTYDADLVVVGIGVVPNVELADAAGLEVSNGVVVDASLRTSDPHVFAVGDCARFPSSHARAMSRLESVQNATDHAKHVARVITRGDGPYVELPWFYSHQGPLRLQMSGVLGSDQDYVVVGTPDHRKFSVLGFRDGELAAVESVNMPGHQNIARRLLTTGPTVTLEQARQPGFDLRQTLQAASTV
jgi:3-phenylpropionate/trans-cinnamate dioxygenase ferredoxin reductase component